MSDNAKLLKTWLPMTETAFYILLALLEPRHGYGITKFVEDLAEGRIKLGSGTIYGTLTKLTRDGLIEIYDNSDKRTVYRITDSGREILHAESERMRSVYEDLSAVEKQMGEKI